MDEQKNQDLTRRADGSPRMPVVFVPHGPGPWPYVDMGMDRGEVLQLSSYLESLASVPPERPRALLVISAHWEEAVPTVLTAAKPPLLFDYYGFPKASYELTWPAPGDPPLATRVQKLLSAAGLPSARDDKRGFDHGTFVPFKLTYPQADIPTVQLSLRQGLDPAEHLALGRALAPLRDEGVFILGSGMSYHNMRGFRDQGAIPGAAAFDGWLKETAAAEASERDRRLTSWTEAPSARQSHPREEHLLPLMVVAGAAGADVGRVSFSGRVLGVPVSGFQFG